jgi:acetoin utilization protein AcuB
MNALVPTVGDCMTPSPYVVASHEGLRRAAELMRTNGIHHLPVMDDGKLVGMLAEPNVLLAPSTSRGEKSVADVMVRDPFVTTRDTPLQEVARRMADRKIFSAVVIERGAIAGVFTATDALAALANLLEGKQVRGVYDSVPTAPPAGHRANERDLR